LEAELIERGLVSSDAIDAVVEHFQEPRRARASAPAWWPGHGSTPTSGPGSSPTVPPRPTSSASAARRVSTWRVVENTEQVHNLVVCTLCSCYPWPILGIPPVWYKSAPYRSRAVREPRAPARRDGLRGA